MGRVSSLGRKSDDGNLITINPHVARTICGQRTRRAIFNDRDIRPPIRHRVVMSDDGRPQPKSSAKDVATPRPAVEPTASIPTVTTASGEIKRVDQLTPEEQMALFEKELKETDWGHQPC